MAFFKKNIVEKSSYEELYYRYNRRIYTYVSSKIDNWDDTMDVMQDIFVHLWKYRKDLNIQNSEAIIFNTCKQKVAEFYRRNKLQFSKEILDNFSDTLPDDIDQRQEYENELDKLKEKVELLPQLRREIFVMNKLDGITQEKIALQFNLPTSTIKYHIAEALLFLKKNGNNS